MASYDAAFFDYINSGSIRSAEIVLPFLTARLAIGSVLDVGCGQGAWLSVWRRLGIEDQLGIDGDYVDRSRLLVPDEAFEARNLEESFDLGRTFDLVQSLEVGEHLPAARAAGYVADLVRHSGLVLFSAAARGQGGTRHINEQDYEYWRRLFAEHGYLPLDYLRPQVVDQAAVEPWYRYNPLLYASGERFATLPEDIRDSRVPDDEAVADVSPPLYRARKRIVRLLPVPVMTAVARVKQRLVLRSRAGELSS